MYLNYEMSDIEKEIGEEDTGDGFTTSGKIELDFIHLPPHRSPDPKHMTILKPGQEAIGDTKGKGAIGFGRGTVDQYQEAKRIGIKLNDVQNPDSEYPVFQWTDVDGYSRWYSKAAVIYLNKDASRMFMGCEALREIDVKGISAEIVETFESTFEGCSGLAEIDLDTWYQNSASCMDRMFAGCKEVKELDLLGFDTETLDNSKDVFKGCDESIDVWTFR